VGEEVAGTGSQTSDLRPRLSAFGFRLPASATMGGQPPSAVRRAKLGKVLITKRQRMKVPEGPLRIARPFTGGDVRATESCRRHD